MKSYRRLGFGNYRVLACIISLVIVLLSEGIAQAAPQYIITCDFCHRMPPLDSAAGTRDPATGAVKGNHQAHAGATAASCAKCHGNEVVTYPTGHRDKTIQMQGNINNSPALGYYSRVFFNQTSVQPNPLGSCSNVNCHFESVTSSWGSVGFVSPGDCTQCHEIAPNTGNHPVAGSKHGSYYGTGTGSCQKCHPDHANEAKPFVHASSAAKRGIAVRFTSSPNNGGIYSGDGLNFLPSQHKTAFGSCSDLYCHSNGTGGAPNVVPTWGASLDCKGCHNSTAASGAPMTSGRHGAHINNAAAFGANYGCAECHGKTVINDTTIADVTRHVKGFVDFSGAKAGRSYTSATGACSTVYCHSDGKGNYKDMSITNWKSFATLDCKGCHGDAAAPAFSSAAGEPNYANGGAGQLRANTHKVHVSGTADCVNCHVNTVDSTGKLTGGGHTNGAIDVAFDTAKAGTGVAWSAGTKSCSNIQCHGTGSSQAQWGSTSCLGCHSVAQGSRAAITGQFGANSHHIQGEVTDDKCYQCHWEANSDGSINPTYHGGAAASGSPVDLVVYGAGARPASYNTVNSATAVQYTANGTRPEIQKINSHCLGCHSDQNNNATPFGDGKKPIQYAWDGTSVAARYAQTGATTWGKYPGVANASPKNVSKAFSAHGNSAANQRGWDTTNGVDGAIANTAGTVNVMCYDCHNSHGSSVSGTTTRYASATVNGGILKDTVAGKGGYNVAYKPYSGGSTANRNKRNPGASLCLDCHLNQTAASTPWGYNSTFGATQGILGYWDTEYFGPGTFGSQIRYPFKATFHMGGHFGAYTSLSSSPAKAIGGLCTPCHDPHGVSPTLGSNMQYAVPLLKGTFLTSPYKEDTAPAENTWRTALNNQLEYHIDQNTFGSDIIQPVAGITETDSQFAGLCISCHPQSSLTTTGTPNESLAWKSKERIHRSVKGWGNPNTKHNYTCSKCHTSHNSRLPRLMVTNCLNSSHKGRLRYNAAPVTGGSDGRSLWYEDGGGSGTGRLPGSFNGNGGGAQYFPQGPTPGDHTVQCHEGNAADQGWNMVTQWAYPATPVPVHVSDSICMDSCSALLSWGVSTNLMGNPVEYYVQVDDASDFSSPNYVSGWLSGTSWTVPLATNTRWYWRVQARDTVDHSFVSNWSTTESFAMTDAVLSPTLSSPSDGYSTYSCDGQYAMSFSWNGDALTQYDVQVSTDPAFGTVNYESAWITGLNWVATVSTSNKYYWRVRGMDQASLKIGPWSLVWTFSITDTGACWTGSCPLVFTWNGENYDYVTDLQGPVIGLPPSNISKDPRLYQPVYAVLNGLLPDESNRYKLKLRESLPEITYIDEVKLLTVDYPEGYQIATSSAENTYNYDYVNPFTIYTFKDPVLPISATDMGGTDILASLMSVDNYPAPIAVNAPDNFYTLDFGVIQHPENAKLLLDGWSMYSVKQYPSATTIQPYLEVVDQNGNWVKAKSFGTIAGDLKTMVIDISNVFLSADQRIRLHMGIRRGSRWVVDRIRLDDSAPVGVSVQELQATSGNLQLGGVAIQSMATPQSRIIASDVSLPFLPNGLGYGNFTKYGEVSELLLSRDDKPVILRHGDRIDVTFPAPDNPQPGLTRGFLLKTDYYYKTFSTSNQVEPLPFHGMSTYPYTAPEVYPTDADHTQYLLEYNTRQY